MDGIIGILLDIYYEEEEEEGERRARRFRFRQLKLRRRILRDTADPFTLGEEYFKRYYRLTPHLVHNLIDLLDEFVPRDRASEILLHIQVLITLRFLAEGSLQKGFGQDEEHPVSQTTACRVINRIIRAINRIGHLFVRMPVTEQERRRVQEGFRNTIRIPGILGLVDCFLVKIVRPRVNEKAFYNYREKHSMNVQIIVNSNREIMNIRVCPGSNNDRHIYNYSQTKQFMENLRDNDNILRREGRYYILGDSGYTPSPTVLTPLLNAPQGSPAYVCTREHVVTRCRVEQTIGILSNRWRAINRGRKLHYSPEKVGLIITACAILHNFIRRNGVSHEEQEAVRIENHNNNINNQRNRDYVAGLAERDRLIQQFY